MKKLNLLLMTLFACISFGAVVFASDVNELPKEHLNISLNDKQYVGRYVLRTGLHPNDPFVLNHLTKYSNQQINYINGQAPQYAWYDVYCDHDHSTDIDRLEQDYELKKITFIGYIIPLNIYGKPMLGSTNINSNLSSIIKSQASIMPKGTWGFEPQYLKTYNNVNKELIMETKGYIGSEMLFKGSAAVDIVNLTCPHNSIAFVNGIEEYKFK